MGTLATDCGPYVGGPTRASGHLSSVLRVHPHQLTFIQGGGQDVNSIIGKVRI
jgi:hypothetical protein